MITYRVQHETLYTYGDQVVTSHNELHLMPRRTGRQSLEHLELRIDPTPDTVQWGKDYFGNDHVFFALLEPHERLAIRTDSRVSLESPGAAEAGDSTPWEEVARRARLAQDAAALEACDYLFDSSMVTTHAELAAFAAPCFAPGTPVMEGVHALGRRIHRDFRYDPEATTLDTPLLEVLHAQHGVCQDYAHVLIGALRSLGLPARYVSGYLRSRRDAPEPTALMESGETIVPTPEAGPAAPASTETVPDPDALVGAEASHAWVAAWCPAVGWFEFDPTNDVVPSTSHVTLGWGRDYDDVSPVKGVTLGGGSHSVHVGVRVRPAEEAPPPRSP